jgi:hypothetical protein
MTEDQCVTVMSGLAVLVVTAVPLYFLFEDWLRK